MRRAWRLTESDVPPSSSSLSPSSQSANSSLSIRRTLVLLASSRADLVKVLVVMIHPRRPDNGPCLRRWLGSHYSLPVQSSALVESPPACRRGREGLGPHPDLRREVSPLPGNPSAGGGQP